MPHLEQWAIKPKLGPYDPPEQAKLVLTGIVTGHPRCKDGEEVTTSSIVSTDGDTVTTNSGTVYTLGEPHPDYEAAYPNARERLFGGQGQ